MKCSGVLRAEILFIYLVVVTDCVKVLHRNKINQQFYKKVKTTVTMGTGLSGLDCVETFSFKTFKTVHYLMSPDWWWYYDECSVKLWGWSPYVRKRKIDAKLCWTFWGFERFNPASNQTYQYYDDHYRSSSSLVLYLQLSSDQICDDQPIFLSALRCK